jgi:hypothetical protein
MKLIDRTLAIVAFALAPGALAYAQQGGYYGATPSSPVARTAYEYREYYAQDPALKEMESGGHVTTKAEDEEAAAGAANGGGHPANGNGANGCANECGEEEENECGDGDSAPEQWNLFDCCWLKQCNMNINGWVAISPFTWNPQNPDNRFNGPVTWTDRSNEFQLNQLYWYVQRTTDTKGYGYDLGYRLDLLYGTDNRFTRATDWDDKFNNDFRFYGLAIPQLFFEPAIGDLKTKIGHFYSPVGYEVVPTTGNFFNTLPYTFQYGEPFTHFGFLSTYGGWERVSLGSGLIRGWDNVGNFNPSLGYLGTFTYTAEQGWSFAFVDVDSQEPNQSGTFSHRHLHTMVLSIPLSDAWTYVGQSDFGIQGNALANGKQAMYYGLNQYLFYKVSDTWTWGIRAEWFRDQQGFRVGGFLPLTNGGSFMGLPTAFSGYAGNFTEVTFGANWKPNANWVLRPNIRWDTFSGDYNNPGRLRPFNDGKSDWQILVGGDIILLY